MKTDIDAIVNDADKKCIDVLNQLVKAELSKNTAMTELDIEKRDIIETSRKHPRLLAFYSGLLAMVNSAINQCNTAIDFLYGELYDYYSHEYHTDLKSTEVKYYITHDNKYRRLIIMKDTLIDQQELLKAIVKAFEQRSYIITNVVNLVLMEHDRSKMEV